MEGRGSVWRAMYRTRFATHSLTCSPLASVRSVVEDALRTDFGARLGGLLDGQRKGAMVCLKVLTTLPGCTLLYASPPVHHRERRQRAVEQFGTRTRGRTRLLPTECTRRKVRKTDDQWDEALISPVFSVLRSLVFSPNLRRFTRNTDDLKRSEFQRTGGTILLG